MDQARIGLKAQTFSAVHLRFNGCDRILVVYKDPKPYSIASPSPQPPPVCPAARSLLRSAATSSDSPPRRPLPPSETNQPTLPLPPLPAVPVVRSTWGPGRSTASRPRSPPSRPRIRSGAHR
jgi:hypothetical protein